MENHYFVTNDPALMAYGMGSFSKNTVKTGLKKFQGVQRRFNKIFTYREASFYDDYAHHPTEIKEVLNGVRAAYKKEEVICVFQPHRISRLKDLKKEFSLSFKKADTVILCPIYAAGEKIKLGFNYNNFPNWQIKHHEDSNLRTISKTETEDVHCLIINLTF